MNKSIHIFFLFAFLLCIPVKGIALQSPVTISGQITDSAGYAIENANIVVLQTGKGTISSRDGKYTLNVPSGSTYTLEISHIGYLTQHHTIDARTTNQIELHIKLISESQRISEVLIRAPRNSATLQRITAKDFRQLPNPSGGIELMVKTMPGVSSNNELSSQYSVRGGNFDENLIYVNEIEIHRPILIRSGQQEGLSFINPDMVASVDFSSGGFDARYGDKMSSVLDVRYRRPSEFAANASVSLLGASAAVEGISENRKFSYISGFRYKTSRYLLGTLDDKGEYNPDFMDWQGLFTYNFNTSWDISLLANVAQNKYHFIPESRNTNFGTMYQAYNLKIYYDGQEVDRYINGLGALTLSYRPTDRTTLKLLGSAYRSHEKETFDIEGSYRLSELESYAGSSDYADSTVNLGVASELVHARNYLDSKIQVLSHTGIFQGATNSLRWSLSFQNEKTDNKLNEWAMLDSVGYMSLTKAVSADNHLPAYRISSYLQYQQELSGNHFNWIFTAGLRFSYNNINKESLYSPRLSVIIKPHSISRLTGHIAVGMYGQPPSYRELRNPNGQMNKDMKAQRSTHYVVGADYNFHIGDKPFNLSSEIYYKNLHRLVPYRLENVRIYYAADNISSGYITGWDVKLNGEFVQGAESWVSFSLMQARQDIINDDYGKCPLPTDQRFNFNLFFQDYIPGAPTWRMFLNLVYGSSLPYSYPNTDRYDLFFRMPAYRRVDIGLVKEFLSKDKPHRVFKQIWANAEIFNLFDTNNTISYLWIQAVANQDGVVQQYAVPNYLTGRRFNIKLTFSF